MGGADRSVDTARDSKRCARPHRLGKGMRLRKRREFLAVQQTGEKFHGRHFLAVIAPRAVAGQDAGVGRVGITVTKRVGNAVKRNRIKRLIREYLRQSDWVPPGVDVVLIAKHSAAELEGYDAVAADLMRIKARMRIGAGTIDEARLRGR